MAFNCLRYLTAIAVCSAGIQVARAASPAYEKVELFAAVKAKEIDVRLIHKNAAQATVIFRNKTQRPLSIQLPAAFAGMPILAQNVGGNSSSSSSSGNQSSGGGMGGGGMGGGMGGGFMDVGPEQVRKVKVATVCLEHGKEDPNPRVPYALRPITDFTQNAELIEVVKLFSGGKLNQVAAQAAAWHLSDGLTWNELAQKVKVQHLNGSVEMYFNPNQVRTAVQAVQIARARVQRQQDTTLALSPGELLDAQQTATTAP